MKNTQRASFCVCRNEFPCFGNEFSHFSGNEFRPKCTKKPTLLIIGESANVMTFAPWCHARFDLTTNLCWYFTPRQILVVCPFGFFIGTSLLVLGKLHFFKVHSSYPFGNILFHRKILWHHFCDPVVQSQNEWHRNGLDQPIVIQSRFSSRSQFWCSWHPHFRLDFCA